MVRNVIPFLLFLVANGQVDDEVNEFRHEHFGTYFLPYTRDSWDKKSCTKEELTVMLKLVSSMFHNIYTPSVGTFRKFGSWKYYHNECLALTAYVAAEINSNANSLLLQVAVGVDIGLTYVEKKMGNALEVAKAANNLFPGTVNSITIRPYTSQTNRQTALTMIGKLQEFGQKVKDTGLEIGYADDDCRTFENSSGEFLTMMDYVMCWYAGHEILPPVREAEKAFKYFMHSTEIVNGFSNTTRVVGRTVRVSKIKDDPNATAEYWGELSRLARSRNFTVIVGYPITNPYISVSYGRSGWLTQVKEEIRDESAFAEKRWLPPPQNKFIKTGLTDLWKAQHIVSANISFEQERFGVLFRPINKIENDGRNYSLEEIVTMLELVATRFHYIVTYRMGPTKVNEDWSQGRADGVSAYAASIVNRECGKRQLKIIVGVSIDNPGLELVELRNAIQVTEVANAEFPETVTGIQLWSYQRIFNISIAMDLLRSKFADKARELALPIGIRLEDCGQFDNNSKPLLDMIEFISCNEVAVKGGFPNLEARRVYSYFEEAREYIFTLSPRVQFIGMTQYLNGMPNQTGKLVEYWLEINKLVQPGNLSVVMTGAFDIPAIISKEFRTSGWWKRITEATGDVSAFREKLSITGNDIGEPEVQTNPTETVGDAVESFLERVTVFPSL